MKTDYGNWVPKAIMKWAWGAVVLLSIIEILCIFLWKSNIACIVILGILIVFLMFTVYMQKCRKAFDFEGGNVMGQVHEFVISKLLWDGK